MSVPTLQSNFIAASLFVVYVNGQYVLSTKAALVTAVDAWVADSTTATATYGAINTWDVSGCTDMSNIFQNEATFNDDISNWDTSQATTMRGMFNSASAFNQDISGWDVSSVTDFVEIFRSVSSFNQPIGTWNTGAGLVFNYMFASATSFDQDIYTCNVIS